MTTARQRIHRIAIAALILALAFPVTARADDDGGGRSVFAYGAGNRALALGGAYAAISDDASAPLWNVGGLGLISRSEFQASHAGYYGFGIDEQYASIVLPHWRWGTFSATVQHFGADDIELRDDRNALVASGLSDSETEVLFGYGRSVGEMWGVGGTLKVQHLSLAGFSGSGVGMDVGVVVRPLLALAPNSPHRRRLSVGLAVRNAIEPKIRLASDAVPDPTGVRVGAAMFVPFTGGRNVLAALDVEKTSDMNTRYHAGFELRVHPSLAVRAGTNDGTFSSGAGVSWRQVTVDYTYEGNDLGQVHRIGATVAFGPTVAHSRDAALAAREAEVQNRLAEVFETRQKQRVRELLDRAAAQQRNGDFDGALRLIAAARALDPDNVDAKLGEVVCLRELGKRQESEGDFAAAAVTYSRAMVVAPNDPEAKSGYDRCRAASDRQAARSEDIRRRFTAALDAFSVGDLVEARRGFSEILQSSPKDSEAAAMLRRTEDAIDHRVDAMVGDANRSIDWGAWPDAESFLADARRLKPDDDRIELALARLDEAKAEANARAGASDTTLASGKTAGSSGSETGGARPQTKELTQEQRREVERLYARGMEAVAANRNSEAVPYFELVLSIDPEHGGAGEYLKREYLMRGMEFFADGRLDEAVAVWEKALRIDPDDERVNGYLSRAREQIARTRQILGSDR
jgi:tetratricopeptide (TPR) repeat protein